MRKVRCVSSCLSVLLLLASAEEAQAANGWLEKLSGPGPFYGWEFPDVPVWCSRNPAPELGGFLCLRDRDPLKDNEDRETGFFIVSLSYSRFHSTENELEYDMEITDDAKEVRISTVTLSLNNRPWKFLDIGVGVGINSFSGSLFPQFYRVSFDLPRVTLRPIAPFVDQDYKWFNFLYIADLVHINYRNTLFPGRFTARDFGAMEGTFDEKGEWLTSYSISVGFNVFW